MNDPRRLLRSLFESLAVWSIAVFVMIVTIVGLGWLLS